MTTLVLELPVDLYERLKAEADRRATTIEAVAQERLTQAPGETQPAMSERDRATEALRAAGLLSELGPEMQRLADASTMTLEEVSDALERAGGKPLSEIILEQRGPKV